jgi:hypothetical protein
LEQGGSVRRGLDPRGAPYFYSTGWGVADGGAGSTLGVATPIAGTGTNGDDAYRVWLHRECVAESSPRYWLPTLDSDTGALGSRLLGAALAGSERCEVLHWPFREPARAFPAFASLAPGRLCPRCRSVAAIAGGIEGTTDQWCGDRWTVPPAPPPPETRRLGARARTVRGGVQIRECAIMLVL